MRRFLSFDCAGDTLAATLDEANGATGLLIVSGGNEIRAGGHANQSRLAAWAAAQGYPAFRYDRPGIGDSAGENRGFLHGGEAIRSAIAAFRRECPQLTHLVGFGNCDAATSLLFTDTELDALVIANPWLIEPSSDPPPGEDAHSMPSSAAIRARYIVAAEKPDPPCPRYPVRRGDRPEEIRARSLAPSHARGTLSPIRSRCHRASRPGETDRHPHR